VTGGTERTDDLLPLVKEVGANVVMRGGMWDGWTMLHAAAYKVSGAQHPSGGKEVAFPPSA
jgi:hypothetical protein